MSSFSRYWPKKNWFGFIILFFSLIILAALLFWGTPFFQRWVGMAVAPAKTTAKSRQWVLTTIWLAALAIILSAWLQLALQALSLGGLDRIGDLLATRGGGLILTRQGLALVGLLVAQPPYPWTALLILGAPAPPPAAVGLSWVAYSPA
jgi:hypothetical protein